jgi:glycosyltransferase involved in cell wall biosynthesis
MSEPCLCPDLRWGFVAASSRSAAEAFARARGIEPRLVITGSELFALRRSLRDRLQAEGIQALAAHSRAWRRQVFPQAYELALALAPVRERYLVDDESEAAVPLSRLALLGRAVSIPLDVAAGMASSGSEALRHVLRASTPRRPATSAVMSTPSTGRGRWILALWRGGEATVGGAVTHITGIVDGFKRAGFRIALMSIEPLPEQLGRVVDEVKVVPPEPRSARVTRDIERLTTNGRLRRAGIALSHALRPLLVYQRHSFLLTAGLDIARACHVPLVLEWNGSVIWKRGHWETPGLLDRPLAPLVHRLASSMERHVAARADLVAAVSVHAAEMACEAGAPRDRVLVVPNGVDVDDVVPAPGRNRERHDPTGAVLGWIGSFGPWHGAEIAIRALRLLPDDVRLVMIGEGSEYESCRALAGSLGVFDRIDWTGFVPHSVALERLGQCDVLISPHVPLTDTAFFGSPTKIFEYMALGKPIVASRLEQIGEVLEDHRTAILTTPGDVHHLARAILDILRSPELANRLAREARFEAETQHTWTHRASAILNRLGFGVSMGVGPTVR